MCDQWLCHALPRHLEFPKKTLSPSRSWRFGSSLVQYEALFQNIMDLRYLGNYKIYSYNWCSICYYDNYSNQSVCSKERERERAIWRHTWRGEGPGNIKLWQPHLLVGVFAGHDRTLGKSWLAARIASFQRSNVCEDPDLRLIAIVVIIVMVQIHGTNYAPGTISFNKITCSALLYTYTEYAWIYWYHCIYFCCSWASTASNCAQSFEAWAVFFLSPWRKCQLLNDGSMTSKNVQSQWSKSFVLSCFGLNCILKISRILAFKLSVQIIEGVTRNLVAKCHEASVGFDLWLSHVLSFKFITVADILNYASLENQNGSRTPPFRKHQGRSLQNMHYIWIIWKASKQKHYRALEQAARGIQGFGSERSPKLIKPPTSTYVLKNWFQTVELFSHPTVSNRLQLVCPHTFWASSYLLPASRLWCLFVPARFLEQHHV